MPFDIGEFQRATPAEKAVIMALPEIERAARLRRGLKRSQNPRDVALACLKALEGAGNVVADLRGDPVRDEHDARRPESGRTNRLLFEYSPTNDPR